MTSAMSPLLTPKRLYRHLDGLFSGVDGSAPARVVVPAVLRETFHTLAADLGLTGGGLYAERKFGFERLVTLGDAATTLADELEPTEPRLAAVLQHGVYLFDRHGRESPGPTAGVAVGTRPTRHVLFLDVAASSSREELDFVLNTIRAALGSRLQDDHARGSMRQAAEIQRSLLVDEPPLFPGFDIAARSVAAEEVGGDFYDFLPGAGASHLALAIGDASGHGLPAALLVRDVVTGLRMGMERELKAAHVFEKLNRVVHRSTLTSRFVSVFYGELDDDGHLIYVNAGHPPPLLFSGERVAHLSTGGTVVGPLPSAQFRRGVARLDPGDVLVMVTDGILEHPRAGGEFYGERGVRASVRTRAGASAQDVLDGLFDDVSTWGSGEPFGDDATAVVVSRGR